MVNTIEILSTHFLLVKGASISSVGGLLRAGYSIRTRQSSIIIILTDLLFAVILGLLFYIWVTPYVANFLLIDVLTLIISVNAYKVLRIITNFSLIVHILKFFISERQAKLLDDFIAKIAEEDTKGD